MKSIFQLAVIAFVVILALQTYESVDTRNVSVLCDPSEVETNECLSFGPLGAINTEGVEFCARTFVEHGAELPRFIATQMRNHANRS